MVYVFCRLFPLPAQDHTVGFDVSPDWDVAVLKRQLALVFPQLSITRVLYAGRSLVLIPRAKLFHENAHITVIPKFAL